MDGADTVPFSLCSVRKDDQSQTLAWSCVVSALAFWHRPAIEGFARAPYFLRSEPSCDLSKPDNTKGVFDRGLLGCKLGAWSADY